jgi:dTDP-4-dehydrorhamnose reductase
MRVVVAGARGLLGAAILREFSDTDLHAFDHAQLDIASASSVADRLSAARPDVVINCAAYNDVDGAEREVDAALRTNALGALSLARAARDAGAIFVHYSTDFVFDGESNRPYVEDDAPNPLGVYAASKLLGEWFSRDCPRAYVLRVESLFGHAGPGSARRGSLAMIVESIRNGKEVPVFVDRTVSPTYTVDIARATRLVIERRLPAGLYHCVNSGFATWLEIAEDISRMLELPLRPRLLTLETANLVARRPRYCALSPSKLADAGVVMPSWTDAVRRYLNS